MVFREETMVQVRSMVANLEKDEDKGAYIENEILRHTTSSATPKGKIPQGDHRRSCLAITLFHAVYKCRFRKVEFLLNSGVNINAMNDYGYNVLVAALHIEHDAARKKMFRYLLDMGADGLQRDPKYERCAVSWAAVLGRNEQVRLMLDRYIGEFEFHEKDRDGMTALHLATQSGHTDVVKTLVGEMVKYGNSVDVTDTLGLTPYLHAKRLGFGYIADILMDEGKASVGQRDSYSFKTGDEWRDIGIRDRNEIARKRRHDQYEQAAIFGSSRVLMAFDGPGYEVIDEETLKLKPPRRPKDRLSGKDDEKDTRSVRIMTPKWHSSCPESFARKRLLHRHGEDYPDGRPDPVTLIQMSPARRGFRPKHFHSSEFDVTKAKQYRGMMGGLWTMMEYLSQQQTASFRRSVPVEKPKMDEETKLKDPRSTWAILFGKNKKGKRLPKVDSLRKKVIVSGKKKNSSKTQS